MTTNGCQDQPEVPAADVPDEDTIAAFATGPGGALAVIRVSGSRAAEIAGRVWSGRVDLRRAPPRTMHLGRVRGDRGRIDSEVLAVYMPGPRSFTGEDVVELQCHGGVLTPRLVLARLLQEGCRHAQPGEFTRRAFINGRIDLTRAEAVADIIGAHTEAALRLANRQLDGLLGRRVDAGYDRLVDLLAEIESRLDFPEEDLDWPSAEAVAAAFAEVRAEFESLAESRREGEILRHGIRLVIAGPPNVGKSSLLNAILGRDRAIVTDIPGTTRDTLEELAHIRGIPVQLVDTAGIRESVDPVERSGISRSFASIRTARVMVWVVDAADPEAGEGPPADFGGVTVVVANKIDRLPGGAASLPAALAGAIPTCALTGKGLEALYDAVERAVWDVPHHPESEVAVNARHAELLERAVAELADAAVCVAREEWELAAVSLRCAIGAAGKITGRTADADVLDRIFSRFCIGK